MNVLLEHIVTHQMQGALATLALGATDLGLLSDPDAAAVFAVQRLAQNAGLLHPQMWNFQLLPGSCRVIADTTGDQLAGLLADVYEREGYAGAEAAGWPIVETTKHLHRPPRGWRRAPKKHRLTSEAYIARTPATTTTIRRHHAL